MSRDVLPIVGTTVCGFCAVRTSWWRRALRAFGYACVRAATPRPRWNGAQIVSWPCAPVGSPVDPAATVGHTIHISGRASHAEIERLRFRAEPIGPAPEGG